MNPARACRLVSLLLMVVAVSCVWSAPVVPEDISDVDDFESLLSHLDKNVTQCEKCQHLKLKLLKYCKVPLVLDLLPSSTSRSVEVPVVRRSIFSNSEAAVDVSRQDSEYIIPDDSQLTDEYYS